MGEAIVFWVLASSCVLSAVAVVLPPFGRNPIHGAGALILCFFSLSGLYVLLAAHLMAALQVIVYAGAIMVLFTFVIMLLNLTEDELGSPRFTSAKCVGVLAIGLVFTKALRVLSGALPEGKMADLSQRGPEAYGGIRAVGNVLLRDFLLPFELTSILLLVAIIGAVIIARKPTGKTL